MQEFAVTDWFVLTAICMITAMAAVFLLAPRPGRQSGGLDAGKDATWIFDGSDLVDATRLARDLIGHPEGTYEWSDLHAELSAGYPTFPKDNAQVQTAGRIIAPAPDHRDSTEVICEWIDGITRVQLRQRAESERPTPEAAKILSASFHELETLRLAVNNAHYPVWRVSDKGEVIWYNKAYETLCETVLGHSPGPDTALFSAAYEIPIPTKKARRSLTMPESGKKLWFDVTIVQYDSGTLIYGVDINAVVDAEQAQRNFVQTLAKTFAQLSTGLAIFDRNRQLVLFNPALIDLTALPADFLSARPPLLTFFDRLRDQQMMPEPKNYGSWRDQMADLVAAAADGRYQETWSLPSGSVYSVSGRPHPDGAVAFLFEDITAEITLTRRFRSDLELGQAIFDRLDDAIAVFSIEGNLTFSNAAYHALWKVDPEKCFAQTGILDAIRSWQEQCQATPVWGDVRDFVTSQDNRAEWWAKVALSSGEPLICSVHPIQSGATMINFTRPTVENPRMAQNTPALTAD
ncbi:PAS-domain containing protein [Sedimentitalea sp. HM32M-2]|uniref:PAS-domain containing protein n=1 Tax=Sedimentitalea sp. HM32M-2 TaxID=3351566 RepID=UPI003633B65C